MGRETILFKSEEKKTRGETAEILRQIADKIKLGNLTLKKGSDSMELNFPENMTVEFKVEEGLGRMTKRSLEIELEWIVGDHSQGSMVIG